MGKTRMAAALTQPGARRGERQGDHRRGTLPENHPQGAVAGRGVPGAVRQRVAPEQALLDADPVVVGIAEFTVPHHDPIEIV